jgi:hypothetical protein
MQVVAGKIGELGAAATEVDHRGQVAGRVVLVAARRIVRRDDLADAALRVALEQHAGAVGVHDAVGTEGDGVVTRALVQLAQAEALVDGVLQAFGIDVAVVARVERHVGAAGVGQQVVDEQAIKVIQRDELALGAVERLEAQIDVEDRHDLVAGRGGYRAELLDLAVRARDADDVAAR